MSRSLINRYLAKELIAPFIFCLLVFTVVLLAGRLMQLADLVISKGVALTDVLNLLATLVPPLLVIIVPLAFLMGIMIGFGRLSADSETIALKATGTGLFNMAKPVFILAFVCTILTFIISVWVAPLGKRAFRAALFDITSKQAGISLQQQVFLKHFSNLVLYANDLDERSGEMSGVFIVEQQEGSPLLILAESGVLHSDPQLQTVTLQLHNGVIHRQSKSSTDDGYQAIGFTVYEITPDISKSLTVEKRQARTRSEMSLDELRALAAQDSERGWAAKAELHRRFCAPLAPLLFALFALPFSTFSQRSGRGGGFAVGLLIYLAYYMLTSLAETMTAEARLSPLATFWGSHLLLFAAGIYLLRQSALERPSALVVWSDRCETVVKKLMKRHENP